MKVVLPCRRSVLSAAFKFLLPMSRGRPNEAGFPIACMYLLCCVLHGFSFTATTGEIGVPLTVAVVGRWKGAVFALGG
jgi:hypothetical protein